jgi:uncharacterized protein
MSTSTLERRAFIAKAELRAATDFVITGKACSYNKLSPDNQLGEGVREMIAPGCFADSIRAGGFQGDVHCLVNHDANRLLGRLANGTLTLNDGPDALRFTVQLDRDNPDHQVAWASVKRGDINECSFAFLNAESAFNPDTDTSGEDCVTRVIKKADLIDVSVVTRPFYSIPGSTSADARSAEIRSQALLAKAKALAAKDGDTSDEKKAENEKIRILRHAARTMAPKRDAGAGDEMALIRDHLQMAHEAMENGFACSDTARQISDNYDIDNSDEDDEYRKAFRAFRIAHRAAHAAMDACCDQMARCRLAQPLRKKK